MDDKIEIYGDEYRVKLENEMLKYENNYLKSIINIKSLHNNIEKSKAYIQLIQIMKLLRKRPISYICRKNSTFLLYEQRYFDDFGSVKFDELLNHRAESDLSALLGKMNKSRLNAIFKISSRYRKLINEYL